MLWNRLHPHYLNAFTYSFLYPMLCLCCRRCVHCMLLRQAVPLRHVKFQPIFAFQMGDGQMSIIRHADATDFAHDILAVPGMRCYWRGAYTGPSSPMHPAVLLGDLKETRIPRQLWQRHRNFGFCKVSSSRPTIYCPMHTRET